MALYAFDGTWNDSRGPERERNLNHDTNVYQLAIRYAGQINYLDGVGSRGGVIGKLAGGVTGAGARKRVKEQFKNLIESFRAGDDEIDIVGYSRGAAIGRTFVAKLETDYDQIIWEGEPLSRPPAVRFLGLFDTVASFGIPWTDYEHDFKVAIPYFVENTFHAMALDEFRESFGLERCLGNRESITEVWFRGGHGDIGGNATYVGDHGVETSNRERSDIPLRWMIRKARACGVPVEENSPDGAALKIKEQVAWYEEAPVTAKKDSAKIGEVGTLSRRLHVGDLVHYSVERSELVKGIEGSVLRRINIPTRIEDRHLECSPEVPNWYLPTSDQIEKVVGPSLSLIELSSRRYPFAVQPARTWRSWLEVWNLVNPGISEERLEEFWSPTEPDRAVAWDVYVELKTRIATEELKDDEGDDSAALTSIYNLFSVSRESIRANGVRSANSAMLISTFLNQRVRPFTAKWHKASVEGTLNAAGNVTCREFREEFRGLQATIREFAVALSHLAGAGFDDHLAVHE